MKKAHNYAVLLTAAALYPVTSFAENSLSATVTATSDYMADGVSATDNKPALQGGIDYEHSSGFYAGVWSSNVDSNERDTANLELDYSVGFKSAITDAVAYDLGVTQYTYHHVRNEDEFNYTEWYAGLTILENTTAYYYYSDDDKVWDGIQRRYILEHTQPLPDDFSLLFTAEHLDYEKSVADDYNAYRVGVGKNLLGMDFTLSYWKNTINHGDATTDNRFVLEISKEFDLFNALGSRPEAEHDHR